MDGVIGFLKTQSRGQLVGLAMMIVSVFFFVGVLASQGGISMQRIEACTKTYNTGEAWRKYGYVTANGLCTAIENGTFKRS